MHKDIYMQNNTKCSHSDCVYHSNMELNKNDPYTLLGVVYIPMLCIKLWLSAEH